MTREQIIESCRIGREKASRPGFAQTPPNPRHLARLLELKERLEMDDFTMSEEPVIEGSGGISGDGGTLL